MKTLKAYIELMRPSDSLLATFATLIGFLIAAKYFSNVFAVVPQNIVFALLAVFLISSAGIVLNDYYDYYIDKINAPARPLPSGRVSRANAAIFSLMLFVLGLFFALFLPFLAVIIAFLNAFLEFLYAKYLKRIALIGNFVDSWFVASTFIFGCFASGSHLIEPIFWLSLLSFLSNVGREIFGDIEDIEGDKKHSLKTLPLVIGKRKASIVASSFIISAVLLSPLPVLFGYLSIFSLPLIALADTIFIYSLVVEPKENQKFTKVAMFIALLAFFFGVWL